jgi:hypothetical protein
MIDVWQSFYSSKMSGNDIYKLADILLELPVEIKCYNGLKVDNIEGLCIFLKRFAYPCRYV